MEFRSDKKEIYNRRRKGEKMRTIAALLIMITAINIHYWWFELYYYRNWENHQYHEKEEIKTK